MTFLTTKQREAIEKPENERDFKGAGVRFAGAMVKFLHQALPVCEQMHQEG